MLKGQTVGIVQTGKRGDGTTVRNDTKDSTKVEVCATKDTKVTWADVVRSGTVDVVGKETKRNRFREVILSKQSS